MPVNSEEVASGTIFFYEKCCLYGKKEVKVEAMFNIVINGKQNL